jgi:hypothetical protein
VLKVLASSLSCLALTLTEYCENCERFSHLWAPTCLRLGRLRPGGAKGPGLFFIMPCIDTYRKETTNYFFIFFHASKTLFANLCAKLRFFLTTTHTYRVHLYAQDIFQNSNFVIPEPNWIFIEAFSLFVNKQYLIRLSSVKVFSQSRSDIFRLENLSVWRIPAFQHADEKSRIYWLLSLKH